jgi:hypothetical protein
MLAEQSSQLGRRHFSISFMPSLPSTSLKFSSLAMGFREGSYTISVTAKTGGPPLQDVEKYITLYQRKSGNTFKQPSHEPAEHVLGRRGIGSSVKV